jgi:hypothetical protein
MCSATIHAQARGWASENVCLFKGGTPSGFLNEFHRCAANPSLQQLRLMGSSRCTQRNLLCLGSLRHLSRLVIGARFLVEGRALADAASAPSHGRTSRLAACAPHGSRPVIDTTFKRVLEGMRPEVGGSLQVLVVKGALEEHMRECLRASIRLRSLQFGMGGASVWSGTSANDVRNFDDCSRSLLRNMASSAEF